MNLLFRSIRSLLLLIASVLFNLLLTLCRFLLLPLLIAVLGALFNLVFLSIQATVNGPGRFIDRLAGEWTRRIFDRVDDREHIHEVYQIYRVLVGGLILLGWSVTGFVTVEILRLVFGLFT